MADPTRDPVALSTRALDSGTCDELTNRLTQTLTELDDGMAIVESFSHLVAFDTGEGLLCVDSSGVFTGADVTTSLRGWSTDRVHSLVYTHGHVDHVGGSAALAADAENRGYELPDVVAHRGVQRRFERYRRTNDWNLAINARQFGTVPTGSGFGIGGMTDFLGEGTLWPDHLYEESHTLEIGDLSVELSHDRGETDDHTWLWFPERKVICAGDFVTWVFPNCGNPQKAQRYPDEWAAALRKMQGLGAEWLIGAHGLPVHGAERVERLLDDLASALESLVEQTLTMMNNGATLDTILHEVRLPDDVLERPWMMPIYDEPEFVVRNIWRLYGGWWDLDPGSLKPAPAASVATELAALAGGHRRLAARAVELSEAGEHRVACQLIEHAMHAAPGDRSVHERRAAIYERRRVTELSIMSQGIFTAAERSSRITLADSDKTAVFDEWNVPVELPEPPADRGCPDGEWPIGESIDEIDALLDEAVALPTHVAGQHLAVVVVHRGQIVAERYSPTTDTDTALISWSMGKSITQALVGISSMIEPRFSIDDRAPVPEWSDPDDPRRAITIDQLLRMSSGLEFNEDYVDEGTSHCLEMLFGEAREDAGAYAASLPLVGEVGQTFNYSSGTTNILCRMLAERHGRHEAFAAWANEVLFDPIAMSLDLTFDPSGTWVGSSFAHATARDFARFGLLYLRDGVWNGKRILPEGWVDNARTRRAQNADGVGYGSHWWTWDSQPGAFYAGGYETQRIVCDPVSDSVVVRLGKTPIDQSLAVDAWIDDLLSVLRNPSSCVTT